MSSPAGWLLGMKQGREHQEALRRKHLWYMRQRRDWFNCTFGVDLKQFYNNIFIGFDLVGFDEWLRAHVEAYDEEKESMRDFVTRKYGAEIAKKVEALI